ncbi:MAG: hypothetical protein IKA47_02180, partial [Oscillospiraceae bacterium]|nr:hypothetical protein [Oscillospiraceae bacterium]
MNKFSKRLLSLLVAVVLIATMLPTVFAEDPVYTDWDGDAAALVDGAYLKLTGDLAVTDRYTIMNKTVTIDLSGKKITSTEAIQLMYITTGGEVTLKNGTIEMPGLATDSSSVMGGLIQVQNDAKGLTLDNVTVTKTGATNQLTHAAILYSRAPTLIKDSTLQVTAAEVGTQEGGLIKISTGCTLTIDNSTLVGTTTKYGGCVFLTGKGKIVINEGSSLAGGSLLSGGLGADIYSASNSEIVINGGTVGAIYTRAKTLDINGGTLTKKWEVKANTATVTVAEGVVCQGFNPVINNITGFDAYLMDKSTGKTNYILYSTVGSALDAAQSGNTVSLMADATADEVFVPAGVTLNLYGKTLTANVVTATAEGAQIKDEKSSKNAGGKLVCENVAVSENNNFAPINNDGVWHFQKFAFASEMEGNVFKFYITDAADAVQLDEHWTNLAAGITAELEVS